MGMYFGIASRLRVKKDADPSLIKFLDKIYTYGESESTELQLPRNDTVTSMVEDLSVLRRWSGNMNTWNWGVKEDHGEFWMYESRSSAKWHCVEAFTSLINGISSMLVLEEGDILYRSISVEAIHEKVLHYTDGKFVIRDGYYYQHDHGYCHDSDHPWNACLNTEDVEAINDKTYDFNSRKEYGDHLPWNTLIIDKAEIAATERRVREKQRLQKREKRLAKLRKKQTKK